MPSVGGFLQRSRHGTVYYFRRRVPADLRTVIGRAQIYKTLQTSNRATAKVRARAAAAQIDQLFETLRAMKSKPEKPIRIDYEIELEFDRTSGNTRLRIDTVPNDPSDRQDAFVALQAALASLPGTSSTDLSSTSPTERRSTRFKDAIAAFVSEVDLKPNTRKAYETNLEKIALPFFGASTELESITQTRIADFAKHIQSLGRAPGTLEGYMVALTAMGKWHRNRGRNVPQWTSATLLPADRTPPGEKTAAFSVGQLQALFTHAGKYREQTPAKFWVTVAIAFFGCRLEELCQINLGKDLCFDEPSAVHYIKLDEEPDEDGITNKSLKRRASRRVMPIHSALVKLGFVDYLRQQIALGFGRPFESHWPAFEDPKRSNAKKWSHEVSKWGGREMANLRSSIGATDKHKYFLSMRHAFASHLANRNVPEEVRAALQGQEHGGVNSTTYTKLRGDPAALSSYVETHLAEYATALDAAARTFGGRSS